MKLVRSPKAGGVGTHRVMSAEATFARVAPIARRIGVTRIADITGLDRIGMPVYSAIMPRSKDCVSVYNGKGATAVEAKVGAVMEAIERCSAWSARGPERFASHRELRAQAPALDPNTIVVSQEPDFDEDTRIGWIEGYDLIRQEAIYVPYYAAAYFDGPGEYGHLCYAVTSTNGLASGNTLEEAVCHALCEVIERDASTLAELGSRALPSHLQMHIPGLDYGLEQDDLDLHASIDPRSLTGTAAALVAMFERVGISVMLRDITSDIGVPTIMCTISDDLHPDLSPAYTGQGTHPDKSVALSRALTEAAQARAVDAQGLREDLAYADEEVHASRRHSKRVPHTTGANFFQTPSSRPVAFDTVATQVHTDIVDDISFMLDGLRARGLDRAIVVDFSIPDLQASVARVIVPGLESWAAVKGKVGARASDVVREAAVRRRNEAAARTNSDRIMNALLGRLPRS